MKNNSSRSESLSNAQKQFIDSAKPHHNEDDTKVKLKNHTRAKRVRGHDVRIVTYTIDEKEYYMSTTNARCAYVIFIKTLRVLIKTNLMDNQKHSIATIKSIYNDRWNVEELFKFVKSNLSLNSIEESQEESASPRFEIHLQQCFAFGAISLISYLFTTLNEKTETESKKILRYFLQSKKTGSINHYCHPAFLKNFYITF